MTRFSVIITCYNQADIIRDAVDSALGQTFRDREVIVVDDASGDGSARLLQGRGSEFRFHGLQTNQGMCVARNAGAALARGDYLVFLDGDDLLLPWALEAYDRIIALRSPRMLLGRLRFFHNLWSESAVGSRPREIRFVDYDGYFQKDRSFRSSGSAMVIRRDEFRRVGGWAQAAVYVDDQDLLLRLGNVEPTVQILEPETVAYRLHDKNAVRNRARLIDASHYLMAQEKAGRYPGGKALRFARRAVIGGFVFFLLKKAWEHRLYSKGFRLLAKGFPMVFAAAVGRIGALLKGKRRAEVFALESVPDV